MATDTVSSVSVLMNTGNGTFAAATNYSLPTSPNQVVSADIDNDGCLDLVTSNRIGGVNSLSVLVNNGGSNGTVSFGAAISTDAGTNVGLSSLVSADFDGDSLADVAASNNVSSTNALVVYYGLGNGSFRPGPIFSGVISAGFVTAGDFNSDGRSDLAQCSTLGNLSISFGR